MNREEILTDLAEIRRIVQRMRAAVDIPSVDRSLRMVEIYCHMMQWQLGGTDQVLPELEQVG
jgi:hypothetical protein